VCGTNLCANGSRWYMNGASVYNPGLRPEESGFLNPTGTVALAQRAGLDAIRIVNFFSDDGIPDSTPYAAATWVEVDQMIADAGAAGLWRTISGTLPTAPACAPPTISSLAS